MAALLPLSVIGDVLVLDTRLVEVSKGEVAVDEEEDAGASSLANS